MSAANRENYIDRDNPVTVVMLTGAQAGETLSLPYRKAVGLLSLQRARLAEDAAPKKRAAKKAPS